MAAPSTLYRFRLDVSDVERSFYEPIDLRIAMHPSESLPYLLTRVIAYALNQETGLEITPGLCMADEPALFVPSPAGGLAKWIEIGNPSARRLHKAAKAARVVRVYTYKDPEQLKREAASESVYRAGEIEVFALEPSFLESLAGVLKRDNSWALIHDDGELIITAGEETHMGKLVPHRLAVK